MPPPLPLPRDHHLVNSSNNPKRLGRSLTSQIPAAAHGEEAPAEKRRRNRQVGSSHSPRRSRQGGRHHDGAHAFPPPSPSLRSRSSSGNGKRRAERGAGRRSAVGGTEKEDERRHWGRGDNKENRHAGAADGAAVAQAAEALALAAVVPAVRDAAGLVAKLARLSAEEVGPRLSGGGGSAKRRGRWVRWCTAVVQTLERAKRVLGQVRERASGDGQ